MEPVALKNALATRKLILYHILFWLLLGYFTLLDFNQSNPLYLSVTEPSVFSVFWAFVFVSSFYFNYFIVMPKIFRNFNWKKLIIGLLFFYLFFVGIRYWSEQILMPAFFGVSNYSEKTNFLYYLYDNLYYSTYPLIPSTLFWLIIFLIRLLEKNASISEEKRNMEVKFLKSQLNPHFMFNTLNNIYSLVYLNSEKALPAIEKLSSIMRFTTYESQKDLVKLSDEIEYFQSYIELEQLRHEKGINIELHLNVEIQDIKIPPLLLSPLVENAVKHGLFNYDHPINIDLSCDKKRLIFEVKNDIGKQKKDHVGGIGLDNLKRRLQIYYPKNHILELRNNDKKFIAKLEIRF